MTGAARALSLSLGLSCSWSCAPPSPAAAPQTAEAKPTTDVDREQQALEKRRSQLQHRVLSELNRLRESRQASAASPEPAREDEPAAEDLMLFGGPSHAVFLGCLCSEERADSVFNLAGEHGSDLASASIRNKFAPYGSNHDDTSACNPRATRPPVVVASSGKSLGLLTLNPALKRRIEVPSVLDWLARMCGV